MSFKTGLSNMSYTNKDFNSIYTELLEYAKKISYKWDPTISDESDPGVVLLKLAAIIGDKDCYNIDKNILELMPASVTQTAAARQLFDQCGYSMRYYRAAEGDVNITIKKDLGDSTEESESETDTNNTSSIEYNYTVPQFTMFSDIDSSTIYTTKEAITIPIKQEYSIPVIEGTIVQYTVNDDSLIRLQNLDSNNRLYFTEENVAENGIFITTVNSDMPNFSNYEQWERVDNLQIIPKGTLCYRFGVNIDSNVCYIEFPDDIESLIGEGLHINYILTSGAQGNIPAGKLRQFYVDTKFNKIPRAVDSSKAEVVDATIENITIKNLLPILNGQDPESIEDAYKNYKRVRDTFETLVSLKDYTDYLVTSESASNGFVCDRTNDIQRSYKILTTEGNSSYTKTFVDSKILYNKVDDKTYEEVKQPLMDAFHLCAYALEYISPVNRTTELTRSFQIVDLSSKYSHRDSIFKELEGDQLKSLQHDYLGFEPNKILMLKNKYPVTLNIVPRHPLSFTEKMQVLSNVETALCNALNSNQMVFGEGASIDIIQNAVLNCDERVKTLIDFVSPRYETYAVYKTTDGNFNEIRIDNDSDDAGYYVDSTITNSTFSQQWSQLYTRSIDGVFSKCTETMTFDPDIDYYRFDSNISNLWQDFRTEIFAKSVLAGITPLYTDDNTYTTSICQQVVSDKVSELKPVLRVSTDTEIKFNHDTDSKKYVSDMLETNENILLTCPNLVEENNYSSYVKVLYHFGNASTDVISDGSSYELKGTTENSDFIIFFWKDSDSAQHYTYVKYDVKDGSLAKFICPTGFNMIVPQNLSSTKYPEGIVNNDNVLDLFNTLPTGKGTTYGYSSTKGPLTKTDNILSATDFVEKCLVSTQYGQVLTGTQIIRTKNINEVHLNNKKDGCQYFYWILNNKTINSTKGYSECVLFDSVTGSQNESHQYTLKSGEYFLYTNDDKTTLYLLGEGTLIELKGSSSNWAVPAIDYDSILLNGIDSVEWYKFAKTSAKDEGIFATEQQQVLIGPQNKIELIYVGKETSPKEPLINSAEKFSLENYNIAYTDIHSNTTVVPEMHSSRVHWDAQSILNLNMSSSYPQKLLQNQTLTLELDIPDSGKNSTTTIIDIKPETSDGIYVQCSEELNMVGGQNIDLRSYFGAKKLIGMFAYTLNFPTNTDGSEFAHDPTTSTTVIELGNTSSSVSFNITKLLQGEYLLQAIPSGEDIKNLKVEGSSPDANASVTSLNSQVVKLKVSGPDDTLIITIRYDTLDSAGNTITIPALYKYSKKLINDIKTNGAPFEDLVTEKISVLDPDKLFDYTYTPINPISNPLVATSFLKKDHYYNPYTICEWDADIENTVTIHDVI